MAKTYVFHEKSTGLNTTSHLQAKTNNIKEKIKKSRENFAAQSTKYDYFRDDRGATWVVSWLGKSQHDAEWRLWTTYKSPMTADDANYITKNLSKAEAIEIFEQLPNKSHEEIISSFKKALKLPSIKK